MSEPLDLRIEQRLTELRDARANLVQRCFELQGDLSRKPNPDSWSALEVLEHLMIVEERVQGQLVRSLEVIEKAKNVGLAATIKARFFSLMVRLKVRVKVPVQGIVPSGKLSGAEIKEHFSVLDPKWDTILSKFGEKQMKLGVFKHPRFGWFSVIQTLVFLKRHTEHHLSQLERLATAKATPLTPIQS